MFATFCFVFFLHPLLLFLSRARTLFAYLYFLVWEDPCVFLLVLIYVINITSFSWCIAAMIRTGGTYVEDEGGDILGIGVDVPYRGRGWWDFGWRLVYFGVSDCVLYVFTLFFLFCLGFVLKELCVLRVVWACVSVLFLMGKIIRSEVRF